VRQQRHLKGALVRRWGTEAAAGIFDGHLLIYTNVICVVTVTENAVAIPTRNIQMVYDQIN
jgi:hypothetical protein